MAVNGRVPIVAAEESGGQLAGWPHVGVRVQSMRDFIGVLLVNAIERKRDETVGFGLVEIRFVLSHDVEVEDTAEDEQAESSLYVKTSAG